MATYYVGSGGNNSNNGTTWALRKLTLNGAEDIPVAAGDTVYVGPGTYRELLTVDVAGSNGSPITYIGDFDGTHTDGVGGLVRITGSDNDSSTTRNQCINAPNARSYRTWQGFAMDMSNSNLIQMVASSTGWIINQCTFTSQNQTAAAVVFNGTGTGNTIRNCYFNGPGVHVQYTNTVTANDLAGLVENCIFIASGSQMSVRIDRVGGQTVRNCTFVAGENCIRVSTALAAGQVLTVNNCILMNANQALVATATTDMTEDYNIFWGNVTNRSNVNTGANSGTVSVMFDVRWFFEMISGKGRMITPFDLASYCTLVNLAGTTGPSTDMRGTGTITTREIGPLEYDATLLYRRVMGRNTE